jgi:glycerophosphoryl diester phosphodiesterase
MRKIFNLIVLITFMSTSMFAQKNISTWNKNKVIAHRGAWKLNNLPENSIASLKQAIVLKCYGSEFDVHITADSILVVNHDQDFMQMPIAQTTYQMLLTKQLPNGENIPTLESYLKTGIKQKHTKLILEIKPQKLGKETDLKLTHKVIEMVKNLKAQPWVEYISFSYDICNELIKQLPNVKVAYLGGEVAPEKLKNDGFDGLDYHFSVFRKTEWLTEAKKLGLSTNAWTVNTIEEMQWLIKNNIDYLTTNEPELLFKVLEEK